MDTGASPRTVSLTIGTAGHIDHGKTSLVKLLTGCDTDRLPEEIARGMTIDLGFATCELPNGRRVGIVDVPGHERFIHNMVAGAAGIDAVMLVVAADDGVMPQTIEHFHIVRLLGVSSGLVALTKIDLADEARKQDVTGQIRALTAGSFLENCPIVPISAKTGEGFDGFYEAFSAVVDRTAERTSSGPFRMHVERAFVLKGLGVIVSGIPRSGSVRTGDAVELLPSRREKKVRGVQVYGEDAPEGRAGECIALRLADISREEVQRGAVLGTPGQYEPMRFVDARFHFLPQEKRTLKPRTAVRFFSGTSDVAGHMVLPDLNPLEPGMETYVQFQLKEPVVAAPGDFFVVRTLSPVRTIGGGCVVSPEHSRMRRHGGAWLDECEQRDRAFSDPSLAVAYALDHAGGKALAKDDIAHKAFVNREAAEKHLSAMVASGRAIALPGGRFASSESAADARTEVVDKLKGFHDACPLKLGMEKKELLRDLKSERSLIDAAIADLLRAGQVEHDEKGYHLADRKPALTARQSAMAEKIKGIFAAGKFATPRSDEVPALAGAPETIISPLIAFLLESGDLVSIADKVILHRTAVEESRRLIADHIRAKCFIDAGACKGLLGTTRKYAIPILEYWDSKGLTKRVGDRRVLRE